MFRITQLNGIHAHQPVTLRVEGRLNSESIDAFSHECQSHMRGSGQVTLDLSGVTFIDQAAAVVIHSLTTANVRIIAASPFVNAVLREEQP